jgi:predicted CopG family antitoxin
MPGKTYTNIRLTTATRDRLKSIGFKGESFDDVIVRLLDAMEKKTSEMQGNPEGVPANS